MVVNEEVIGKRYRSPRPYEVGREKIREFARAVKSTHAAHFEVEAARGLGYSDLVAPPTFAILVSQCASEQLIDDKDTGFDFSRLVHAEQRFMHRRPIVAGDVLAATAEVTSVRRFGPGTMLTVSTEVVSAEKEAVATVVSKLLISDGGTAGTEAG